MADWYASSAAYAAVSVWAASTAYTVGQFVKPTAPAFNAQYAFRCTVAGTSGASEPTWSTASANNATIVSGGATFTNVTGQSTYGWSAPAGTLNTISGTRPAAGDRVFLSSDHTESSAASLTYPFNTSTAAFGLVQIISVNRAGSVPPTASDILSGASITTTVTTGSLVLDAYCNLFWQGIAFTLGGTGVNSLYFNNAATARKSHYLKNCALILTNTNAGARITTNSVAKVVLDNTTIQFGAAGQAISSTAPFDFNWINTPSAIQGVTIPTKLFACGTLAPPLSVLCRGVDLSAITTTLCSGTTGSNGGSMKALFDSCQVASGVTRLATPAAITNAGDEVELMNCFDGTNIINERYAYGGSLVIDRSTTLTGGAADDVGAYSLKLAASVRADFQTMPLDAFWLDVENTAVGVAKTATIEVASSLSLNNTDIRLQLEHMSTSGSSLASFVENLASVLTPAAALSSSSNSWTTSSSVFASWNPADLIGLSLSNNNLTASASSGTSGVRANFGIGSSVGKYYWEVTLVSVTNGNSNVGMALGTVGLPYTTVTAGTAHITKAGLININGSNSGLNMGTRNSGDVIGIAVDFTAQLIWFRVAPSGNWNANATNNPATGVGGLSISAMSGVFFPTFNSANNTEIATANFGASAFSGAVPSGFAAGILVAPTNKQQLQATFTPRTAGRVRGLVRLGKTSATVWVNPQIAIA